MAEKPPGLSWSDLKSMFAVERPAGCGIVVATEFVFLFLLS